MYAAHPAHPSQTLDMLALSDFTIRHTIWHIRHRIFTKMADKWLTPKQFRFVQAIIQGKTHAEAYKAAGFSAHSVKVAEPNARKLLAKYAVARAIEIGRAAVAERSLLTAELIIERLEEARQLALSIDPPQIAGAVAATMGQAKISGLLIDRSEAHIVHHRPAPSPVSKTIELTEEEWKKQFDPDP